jgi:putative heme-binding domain-containing protein
MTGLFRLGHGTPALLTALVLVAALVAITVSAQDTERVAAAVDAITRLPPTDLSQNSRLKEAVDKLLEKTRGTPGFLRLVQHFSVPGQETGLLELAARDPAGETGVAAVRLVLDSGKDIPLRQALNDTNGATKLVQALGSTGDKRAVPYLLPILNDRQRDPAVLKQAVRALARSADGAGELLVRARTNGLADELRFTAGAELSQVRWPAIREEAARLLPLPQGRNAQPLPPLGELLAMKGDPASGAKVFTRETAQCSTCHRVGGQGGEVGPDLTEIGSKLGKDALLEAILEPSAGISFGFEAWTVELKSGDEAYGLIVSETGEEIAVKDNKGLITRHKKSDVAGRTQMKLSIMPVGLQEGMTAQELADLIEYLASLKKPDAK